MTPMDMDRSMVVHDTDDPESLVIEGYASTYDPYRWPPNGNGWMEQIPREAFEAALAHNPDVHLQVNFDTRVLPLARSVNGSLELIPDEHGLKLRAVVQRQSLQAAAQEPDNQRVVQRVLDTPDGQKVPDTELAISFRAKDQQWSDDNNARLLRSISLRDVGICDSEPPNEEP